MPTGQRFRWFDAAKGSSSPVRGRQGRVPCRLGHWRHHVAQRRAKVEYSVVDGRRGPQAMDVRLIASTPSGRGHPPEADDMKRHLRDLIKMPDAARQYVAPSPLPICCRQQKKLYVAACGGGSIRCTGRSDL